MLVYVDLNDTVGEIFTHLSLSIDTSFISKCEILICIILTSMK